MEQVNERYPDGEEMTNSLHDIISGVDQKESDKENYTNMDFDNSQGSEPLDDSEQKTTLSVTQTCKGWCEDEPRDILLENNIQEVEKENCFIETSTGSIMDDKHLDTSPGEVSLEFSVLSVCSNENMGFSKGDQTDVHSENQDVNITRFKKDVEKCEKNKMKDSELNVIDGVRVDMRSENGIDGSLSMNTSEDADKANQLKPRLQDEEKGEMHFEQGKNDETESNCNEITDEGHSAMQPDKPPNETTNNDHFAFSTADQTDSNLHDKFTDASDGNDNKNELKGASSYASVSGDGSVDQEPVDRRTQKPEIDFFAENIVKEGELALCNEDEAETKGLSSAEIFETHEPISDERNVIELGKYDPSLRKPKLARQPRINRFSLSNETDDHAPTPLGVESKPNHNNPSSDSQVSSSSLPGSSHEVSDNIESNTSTSSRIQNSQEMATTNSLLSRDSVANQTAVSVDSSENSAFETSNTEIPLASKRLLTRLPKKLVKTLSNPPGVEVERGALLDANSPCTSTGQEPKYKTLKKRLLRKSKSEPGKEDPSAFSEARHRSFVDSLLKKIHKGVDHITTKAQGDSTRRHTAAHNENIDEDHTNISEEFYLPRTESAVVHKSTDSTGHEKLSKKTKFFGSTKRRSEKRAKKVMSVIEESSRIRNDDFEDFAHIQMYLAAKETLQK